MEEYDKIIEQLGHAMSFPLKADRNGSVVLLIEEEMRLQIELEKEGQFLMVAATIGDLSPGPLRQKILHNALRANASPHPRYGIFAYSRQANQLVLFDWIRMEGLTGRRLFEYLEPFAEKAWAWTEGVKRGSVPEPTVRKASMRPRLTTGGANVG